MSEKKVTIYGASDDLIELEGDIREEFSCYGDDEGNYLAFSDGTVLHIVYNDEGVWRITPKAKGTAKMEKTEAVSSEDDNYTDRVTLTGDVRWCVHGKGFTGAKK